MHHLQFYLPLPETSISHLGKRKSMFKHTKLGGGICWVLGSVKETLWQKKSPSLLGSIFATCWGFCSPTPEPQNSENTSLGKDAGFMDDKPHLWNVCFLGDEAHALYKIHMSNGLNLLHPRKDVAEMVIVFCVSLIVPEDLMFAIKSGEHVYQESSFFVLLLSFLRVSWWYQVSMSWCNCSKITEVLAGAHINKYSLVYKQLPNIYYIYTCKFCLHNSHYRLCSRRLGVLCPSVEVWNCQEGFDQRNVGLTPSDHSEFLQVPIGLVQ